MEGPSQLICDEVIQYLVGLAKVSMLIWLIRYWSYVSCGCDREGL